MKSPKYGRAPIASSMPPLAEACAGFKGFARNEKRADRIFELLLVVIQRCRAAKPKRFYTLRDVAKFFGVSVCTVGVVYRRLSHEGVLTRMRSSQTMIPARAPRPRLAVRGVVCMPIWLPGFLHVMDWRRLFSEFEEELSRHRFVLQPIFYKQDEEINSDFVDRVLKFNPDYMLWNYPAESDRMTMESIADAGVTLLTILGQRDKPLPGRIYRTSHEQAWRRGLADWKASSEIDRVVVISFHKKGYDIPEHIRSILQDCGLPYEFALYDMITPLPRYLKRLSATRRAGIVFADDVFFARLCGVVPEEMFTLFRRHRVMVPRRVTMQSMAVLPDVTVDWLHFPHRQLARRIATDLSQSKGALPSTEEVFEAEWRPHTPLDQLVQNDFYE